MHAFFIFRGKIVNKSLEEGKRVDGDEKIATNTVDDFQTHSELLLPLNIKISEQLKDVAYVLTALDARSVAESKTIIILFASFEYVAFNGIGGFGIAEELRIDTVVDVSTYSPPLLLVAIL
jgi:hypothetical protein